MKKFFTTLLVLIIVASLGAFFGWAQLGVPPDSYGVMRSKSHGVYPRLIKPGEFTWVWYKLIPTNTTTSAFRLNPVRHAFSVKSILPSGNTYSAFAGIAGDFSWEINADFSFSLNPESLITLVADSNIGTQEELEHYEKSLASQIEAYILRCVQSGEEFAGYIESLLKDGKSPEFERQIQGAFPFVGNFSIDIKSAHIPDYTLYNQAKDAYDSFVTLQKGIFADNLTEQAKSRFESYIRFHELEQYGFLLDKYPILLEYLMLERNKKDQ